MFVWLKHVRKSFLLLSEVQWSGEEVTHKGPSVLVGRHYAFHFKVIFELWRQWARFMRSYGMSPLDLENH